MKVETTGATDLGYIGYELYIEGQKTDSFSSRLIWVLAIMLAAFGISGMAAMRRAINYRPASMDMK
ncbi:MAG: hypothetical protein R2932_48530 [Caldilineaceae bacterium]